MLRPTSGWENSDSATWLALADQVKCWKWQRIGKGGREKRVISIELVVSEKSMSKKTATNLICTVCKFMTRFVHSPFWKIYPPFCGFGFPQSTFRSPCRMQIRRTASILLIFLATPSITPSLSRGLAEHLGQWKMEVSSCDAYLAKDPQKRYEMKGCRNLFFSWSICRQDGDVVSRNIWDLVKVQLY